MSLLTGIVALFATLLGLLWRRAALQARSEQALRLGIERRFKGVVDAERERQRVLDDLSRRQTDGERQVLEARKMAEDTLATLAQNRAASEQAIDSLEQRKLVLQREVNALDEEAHLQSFGFYHKHFEFATSSQFDSAIADVERRQKDLVKAGKAALCTTTWTVGGSEREGQRFVKRLLTLMLRAFNGECDAAIAKVRYNNVEVMEARIRKSCEAINKLTTIQHCHITDEYLRLRLEELFLTHEQHELAQEEKEEQRRIREQMREEEIAQREIEKARLEAEKEERRYEDALAKARREVVAAEGLKQEALRQKIAEMEARLAAAHEQKERAIARAQLTRSGHVYVISNIGSFGERVFKIGMTRRLEPLERIRELGDASVPFEFDIHAVIYTEDAPALETKLHRAFADRRINLVNERKEFFDVSIDEVVHVVRENHGDVLITRTAAAEEYRKTVALRAERGQTVAGWGSYDRRSAERATTVVA